MNICIMCNPIVMLNVTECSNCLIPKKSDQEVFMLGHINTKLCTLYTLPCTVQCTMFTVHCTMYCTVYSAHCTVDSVYCTLYHVLYSVQCSLYTVPCTVQCTVYSVHCTLYHGNYTVQIKSPHTIQP